MTTDFEDMEERPRGVLTQTDREFLRISPEDRYEQYSRQGRSRRYRTIRDRLTNSVLDLPLIVNRTDAEMFEDAFSGDDDDVPRVQTTMSDAFRFLIRAILADEPHRPIETTADLAAALSPVIHQFERGVEKWLNTQRQMTGDFELTVSTETMRSIDSVVEELEIRRSPLTGEEWARTGAVLERAGYDDAEITALIGEDPDGDESGSEYPMHQLVEFPIETLTELVAEGKITETEHTTAIRQKAETGDI